ncbi:MAG TPA: tRNA pseudouridine(38-40) synthase TruA [Firmicutes bacterium]|nr:tRNA pseudouridine(38-40) synthase TruA [Bacillota bacterium]
MMVRHLCLTVQYDGSGFHGFQVQNQGVRTVQGELEKALETVMGESVRVTGAGRTDAGVHALGQVVSFWSRGTVPTERLPLALNSLLPADVVVTDAKDVGSSFDARRSKSFKTYRYLLDLGRYPNPITRHYALHYPHRLDLEKIREGIAALPGEHDFAGFAATGSTAGQGARGTVRFMRQAQCDYLPPGPLSMPGDDQRLLAFTFSADGFLYKMVRLLVGTLLEVGSGRRPPGDVAALLQGGRAVLAVPAHGLCLLGVEYEEFPA